MSEKKSTTALIASQWDQEAVPMGSDELAALEGERLENACSVVLRAGRYDPEALAKLHGKPYLLYGVRGIVFRVVGPGHDDEDYPVTINQVRCYPFIGRAFAVGLSFRPDDGPESEEHEAYQWDLLETSLMRYVSEGRHLEEEHDA